MEVIMSNRVEDNKKSEIKKQKAKSSGSRKTVKIVYNICMVLLAIIFISCAVYLINYFWQSKKSEDKVEDLKALIVMDDPSSNEGDSQNVDIPKKEIEYVDIDGVKVQKKFEKIYRKNSDFIGWISIAGTEVDYPVMQTMDNEEYYIDRDFDGDYSSAGTLFADTSSDVAKPSDNILIYGHNMKTGKMFHDILDYENEDFYKNNKYITFDSIHGNGTYEVIAAFRTQIYSKDYTGFRYYQFFDAQTEEEFSDYINNCKSATAYNNPVEAFYGDKLLTLSTCAYHDDEGRFVVVAKKVE